MTEKMTASDFIKVIALKEIHEIVRDGRLRLLGALVMVLACTALAFGAHQTHRAQKERAQAHERATAQWQGQGKKNPHVAAHYGTHVFAPASVATAIDPGSRPTSAARSRSRRTNETSRATPRPRMPVQGSKWAPFRSPVFCCNWFRF